MEAAEILSYRPRNPEVKRKTLAKLLKRIEALEEKMKILEEEGYIKKPVEPEEEEPKEEPQEEVEEPEVEETEDDDMEELKPEEPEETEEAEDGPKE